MTKTTTIEEAADWFARMYGIACVDDQHECQENCSLSGLCDGLGDAICCTIADALNIFIEDDEDYDADCN
jgi:hypothetical protein